MNWLTLVKMFSGPIGNLITTGLTAAAGAGVTWAVSKGLDQQSAAAIASGLVLAIAATVNSLTGTQIVQIQNVRENPTNGVTVVPVEAARKAGIQSVNEPRPDNVG